MRSAVAKALGISEDKVHVEYGKPGTVSLDLDTPPDPSVIAAALEGTKYELVDS